MDKVSEVEVSDHVVSLVELESMRGGWTEEGEREGGREGVYSKRIAWCGGG